MTDDDDERLGLFYGVFVVDADGLNHKNDTTFRIMAAPVLVALSLLLVVLLVTLEAVASEGFTEEDRKEEFYRRGYSWPVENFIPDSPGWAALYEHRFRQAAEIETKHDRWEAYAQLVSSAVVQPNFTSYGFGLARAPEDLMEALRQGIHDGLAAGTPTEEKNIPVIEGPLTPWLIDRPDLTKRVSLDRQ
jgi:hypothetical protein